MGAKRQYTQHATRNTHHAPRSTLLPPLPLPLRPGPDEQADAGDLAFCALAAGLVAAGPSPAFHEPQSFIGGRAARSLLAVGGGETPLLCALGCIVRRHGNCAG